MNQAGTNLSHGDGSIPPQQQKLSYTAIVKQHSPSPPAPLSTRTKCVNFFRDPTIPEGMNLHVSSSYRTSLIFQLKKKHDPAKVALRMSAKYKKNIVLIPVATTYGHTAELVFDRMANYQECYNDLKQGFEYEGDTIVPLVPTPDHHNIIKISIHHLPDAISAEELSIQLAPYGRMLEAGRYTILQEDYQVYLGHGYALLSSGENAKMIPGSLALQGHKTPILLRRIMPNTSNTTNHTATPPNINPTTQNANR
ncbi:hypothetical protein BG004_004526, partial [Podila humilis]